MRKNQILQLFFLLYIFFFNNFVNASIKHKSRKVKIQNKSKENNKKNIRKKFSKRNLQNEPFVPLSIYLDKEEFKHSIPDELRDYEGIYSNAMDNAAEILEGFLEIQPDLKSDGKIIDEDGYILEHYGITQYTEIFNKHYLNVKDKNFYILSKFTNEISEESESVLLDELTNIPLVGIVLFNNNIDNLDKTKLTLDYLTTLMLHHFIRLLGFNAVLSDFAYINILPHEKDNEE